MQRNIIRYVIGYLAGFLLFFVIIPLALYAVSRTFDHYAMIKIIAHDLARVLVALLFLLIGLVFVIWANVSLFLSGKGGPADAFGVAVSPRTKCLVVNGPYRYTRNPMVFGALACYVATSLYLNSLICLALLCILIPLGILYIRIYEEKRLLRDFGEGYMNYTKSVSMILPLPNRMEKTGR
jgi:protein-S-isoprenylcysteine O-methyltransferase Ste14